MGFVIVPLAVPSFRQVAGLICGMGADVNLRTNPLGPHGFPPLFSLLINCRELGEAGKAEEIKENVEFLLGRGADPDPLLDTEHWTYGGGSFKRVHHGRLKDILDQAIDPTVAAIYRGIVGW